MKLEPNKIYKLYVFENNMYCPTLSIKGNAQIYVSLSGDKPESTDDMILCSDFEVNKVNTVIGMFRWICADYDDTSSSVEECGLISSPFINKMGK
ncbi:MAG: hypothetical protein NC222_06130 [Staphylococcus sp.]|nr:hypothetical protein [Staphylococcus sp.]